MTDTCQTPGCGHAKDGDRALELLRSVIAYDNANQSDLPLVLLDEIRALLGGPR